MCVSHVNAYIPCTKQHCTAITGTYSGKDLQAQRSQSVQPYQWACCSSARSSSRSWSFMCVYSNTAREKMLWLGSCVQLVWQRRDGEVLTWHYRLLETDAVLQTTRHHGTMTHSSRCHIFRFPLPEIDMFLFPCSGKCT